MSILALFTFISNQIESEFVDSIGKRVEQAKLLNADKRGAVSVEIAIAMVFMFCPLMFCLTDISGYLRVSSRLNQGIGATIPHIVTYADGTNTAEISSTLVALSQTALFNEEASVTVNDRYVCYPANTAGVVVGAANSTCSSGGEPVQYVEVVMQSTYKPMFSMVFNGSEVPLRVMTRVRVGGGDG